jgi:GT2 family glycosyltransferase
MTPVSIIVPSFERIDQTIRTIGLLVPSYAHFELIVSDSTPDASLKLAVAKAFGDRVIYTRPEKPGIAANKNQGARIARHPILIFCDSDMEVEPEAIGRTVKFLMDHDNVAAVGGTVLWRGGPNDGKPDRPRPEDRRYEHCGTVYVEAIYSRYIAIYKEVFLSVGGYDERVFRMRGEGSDLSARLWRAGWPLAYDDSIVVHHVWDAPDSAAIRVPHPEWGVGRDLLLLAYKYGMLDSSRNNFLRTVAANFPEESAAIEAFRAEDKPRYPFGFLEVFSDEVLFKQCVSVAADLLRNLQ